MAVLSSRNLLIVVGLATLWATFTSVSWLSGLILEQQEAARRALAEVQSQSGRGVIHRADQSLPQSLPWVSAAASGRSAQDSASGRAQGQQAKVLEAVNNVQQAAQPRQKSSQEILPREIKLEQARIPGQKRPSTRPKEAGPQSSQCRPLPHTDYWGEPVVYGPTNKQPSAEACCNACSTYKPATDEDLDCNVWVYCGDPAGCGDQFQHCWLKHLAHPEGASPQKGPEIPWTAGVFGLPDPTDENPLDAGGDRRFHVVVTAQGTPTHWQVRVHYYWYLKVKRECEAKGNCHMGGWTRLLHSGVPDELVSEIPTHVVKPLQDRDHKGYVVLNRPWAFVQWVNEVNIPERYVLMSEPDHVWLRPMPNLMRGERPAAFPFFYIEPSKPDYRHITEKFTGKLTRKQAESISPIGNAPTLLSLKDLRHMAVTWMNTSHAIFDDEEAHKEWGWVMEMYGFTISCYLSGVGAADLHLKMMAQPPWDKVQDMSNNDYYLLHYTYGMDYTLAGDFTPGKIGEWRFDKRTWHSQPPPRNLELPPPGMNNALVRHLIQAINEASSVIPSWDEYHASGTAIQFWDGQTFA